MAAYLVWRLANISVRRLPRRISYPIAALLADLVFLCWPEKRRNTVANMRHVVGSAPPQLARRVARDSFRQYARYLVDFIRAADAAVEDLERRIEFHQWAEIDAAFADGRGVLFVLLHFGNWDWGAAVFSNKGYPLNMVVETFRHKRLNEMVVSTRRAGGARVLPMERGALPLLRALRRNEGLAILIDRPDPEHGIPVQFFGATAYVPAGPARLALRSGARVVAVALARVSDASDELCAEIDANIRITPSGDLRADARALTEAMLRAHERFVRQHPEQWYMFRRMWPQHSPPAATPARA